MLILSEFTHKEAGEGVGWAQHPNIHQILGVQSMLLLICSNWVLQWEKAVICKGLLIELSKTTKRKHCSSSELGLIIHVKQLLLMM